jgi:hypothetical protein
VRRSSGSKLRSPSEKDAAQAAQFDVRMLHSRVEPVSMPRRQLTAKQQVFLEQLLASGDNAAVRTFTRHALSR